MTDECKCHQIEREINEQHPGCHWNCDAACDEWLKRVKELPDNNIEYEEGADENWACTCPACGRVVCVWCV
jgi:hypothetical protein